MGKRIQELKSLSVKTVERQPKSFTTLNFGGGCGMSPGCVALCDILFRSSPHIQESGSAPSVPIDEHCAITGQLSLLSGDRRDGMVTCFLSR
jgi:hypothetical protein